MSIAVHMKRNRPEVLQEMCLKVIVKNFTEVLSKADRNRGVKFLQRNAQLLWSAFKEVERGEGTVSLEHVLFCMNRYLKELHLGWVSLNDQRVVIWKLRRMDCALTVVSIPPFWIRMPMYLLWMLVCSLPATLQCLYASCTTCTNSMMEIVRKRCPKLQQLDLDYSPEISDSGIKSLCRKGARGNFCQNLTLMKLDLRGTNVTYKGIIFAVENFPNLTEISHDVLSRVIYDTYNCTTSNNCIVNIKSLFIKQTKDRYCDVLKACTAMCPYVTKLEVDIVTQAELTIIAEYSALLKEVIFNIAQSCCLLPFLEAKGNTLRRLIICNCSPSSFRPIQVSLEDIVKYCPSLEYLRLRCMKFSEMKSIAHSSLQCALPHLTNLKVQLFDHVNVEEALLFLMSRSPNLKVFVLNSYIRIHFSSSFLHFVSQHISLDHVSMFVIHSDHTEFFKAVPNFSVNSYVTYK